MYHGNVSRIISSAPVRANMTWDCCLYSYLIHIWIGAYTLIEDGAASDVTPQRNQCDLVLRSNMWVDIQAGYHQSTFINKKYISAAPHCLQLPSSQIAKYGQISDIWLKVCWSWTWPSGVSLKRASKMQLRNVDLRYVGHSIQKLWTKMDFGTFSPCISFEHEKSAGKRSFFKIKIWKLVFELS